MNFKLLNNVLVPDQAYGTWLIDNDKACECVKMALQLGYRHIDTAQAYRNEEGVGQGIKKSGLKREEIFITSKVKAEIKDYENAKQSIDESLRKLGVDYIDLMLIHCPQPWALFRGEKKFFEENVQVWKAMVEAYHAGKLRSIGVSNFNQEDIKNIMDHSDVTPMVNQICLHIGCTDLPLIKYCQDLGIVVEAYSPIAHGRALNNSEIQNMAQKYGVSIAQLCIKYTLQLNTITIPKASSYEHIKDNLQLDFTISDEDMELLTKIQGV